MNKDALLRVVKAARMSLKLAEDTKKLLVNERQQTWADEIAGLLSDALFHFSGDYIGPKQDFERDSRTMNLLRSNLSDGAVTEEFIAMVQQPRPVFTSPEEFKDLYHRNGGYMVQEAERPE